MFYLEEENQLPEEISVNFYSGSDGHQMQDNFYYTATATKLSTVMLANTKMQMVIVMESPAYIYGYVGNILIGPRIILLILRQTKTAAAAAWLLKYIPSKQNKNIFLPRQPGSSLP